MQGLGLRGLGGSLTGLGGFRVQGLGLNACRTWESVGTLSLIGTKGTFFEESLFSCL